jgi:hypothetical protein
VVDGEQVIGAKQNRIFNASFLVSPGSTVELPVSCVEQRRWHYDRSRDFTSSGTTLTSSARRAKLHRVTASAIRRNSYAADQSAVWQDVDDYLERTSVTSTTSAFSDGYTSRSMVVEQLLPRLQPVQGQVGLAALWDGKLVTLDVFGSASLYARGWRKVARGVLGELYGGRVRRPPEQSLATVQRLLGDLTRAKAVRKDAPGGGHTLHGSVRGAVYGAISDGGRIYHAVLAGS